MRLLSLWSKAPKRRHAEELQQLIDNDEMLSKEQAAELACGWKKKKPAGSVSASHRSDHTDRNKQVRRVYAAIKKAADRVPEEDRSAVLVEALQYYFHYHGPTVNQAPVTIVPAPAEEPWVLDKNEASAAA